jgi:hypothetical protein
MPAGKCEFVSWLVKIAEILFDAAILVPMNYAGGVKNHFLFIEECDAKLCYICGAGSIGQRTID